MASVNIPQANSVETLTHVVEAIDDGVDDIEQLVREFEVRQRTIHYYLELAEWLGFLENRKAATFRLTDAGTAYASDIEQRADLYREGVLGHELVERALEEADEAGERDFDGLKDAFTHVITEMGVLAEATARRRAGALSTLVQAALDPDLVEWESGRMGQPASMRRTYAAHDAPIDVNAETTSWERPRNPQALVGEGRFGRLQEQIRDILAEIGPSSSSEIRDELALRHGVPLTDPSIFVVIREGVETGQWRSNQTGVYQL
jgi:hypothetical protein